MQVISIAECSKGSILHFSTFIKLAFVIKIFSLSIFEWPFYTGFTVHSNNMYKLNILKRNIKVQNFYYLKLFMPNGVLEIRRTFSLVDIITNTKLSNRPDVFLKLPWFCSTISVLSIKRCYENLRFLRPPLLYVFILGTVCTRL